MLRFVGWLLSLVSFGDERDAIIRQAVSELRKGERDA